MLISDRNTLVTKCNVFSVRISDQKNILLATEKLVVAKYVWWGN